MFFLNALVEGLTFLGGRYQFIKMVLCQLILPHGDIFLELVIFLSVVLISILAIFDLTSIVLDLLLADGYLLIQICCVFLVILLQIQFLSN